MILGHVIWRDGAAERATPTPAMPYKRVQEAQAAVFHFLALLPFRAVARTVWLFFAVFVVRGRADSSSCAGERF